MAPQPTPAVPARLWEVNLSINDHDVDFRYTEIVWPVSCVEMNDWIELASALLTPIDDDIPMHLGNIGIYERVFGDGAEAACRRDHQDDVRSAFRWAF